MPETTTPAPPEHCPKYLREGLPKQSPALLREIVTYAEALAEHKEATAEREFQEETIEAPEDAPDEWEQDEWDEVREQADAPAKATLTTKEIDGRQYYYYQWREGHTIKSEYVSPVHPSE